MYQRTHHARVAAPPERVFPLLCPVREREWVPGWHADILHSTSGVAELGCVFRTEEPSTTWIIHEHTPPRRIGFTLHAPDRFVELLTIELVPDDDGRASVMTLSRAGVPIGDQTLLDSRFATASQRLDRLVTLLATHLAS
jgi:uncharacterized protein YndB with AHSA1/START domain